ncbi:MBL fold metallo-hydrolase [Patescibacteria group bacterium]
MYISWHGLTMCKIGNKETTVVVNPFDASTGLTPLRPKAEVIALSAQQDKAFSNIKAVKGDPFVITGPGEYEIAGISIQGIQTFHDNTQGKDAGLNNIYVMDVEGVKVCHLGYLGHSLTDKQLEKIGEVDVLLVPVGGGNGLDTKKAVSVTGQIEPRIVIPINYKLPKIKAKLSALEPFLKEMGATGAEATNKLSLRKSNLPSEDTEVVVLNKT